MHIWMIWTIVAAIGLVVALVVHSVTRQAQGASLLGTLLLGIVGALFAASWVARMVHTPGVTVVEERYVWAVVGSIVISFLYELAATSSHRGRVLIPAPRGR